jgi:hypothetical protein
MWPELFVETPCAVGNQHCDCRTMRANHAVFDPIFIQYIITVVGETKRSEGNSSAPTANTEMMNGVGW